MYDFLHFLPKDSNKTYQNSKIKPTFQGIYSSNEILFFFIAQGPPSAPKPGVWTPPAAPAAKPFTPKVQPPAPAAPGGPKMGAPRNPTGVNAVRAKKGEATIFKTGDNVPGISRVPVCASCNVSIR